MAMRSLGGWRRAIRNVVFRARFERELAAELEWTAAELERERLACGATPGAARRDALLALGGIEQVKDAVRDVRAGGWLDGVANDVRFAVRSLRRARTYTAVAALTLALGVGGTAAVLGLVRAAFAPPGYPHGDRLVHIWSTWPGGAGNMSFP